MRYEDIFENMKRKSIGKHKIVNSTFTKKNVVFKTAISTILSVFLTASIAGCGRGDLSKRNIIRKEYSQIYANYGVHAYDIQQYELSRIDDILEENGLNQYTVDQDGLRVYPYTANDYKAVQGLDDSYLYAFYGVASDKDVDEMVKSFGYSNLEDYLKSMGFVHENGKVDLVTWAAYDSVTIAKMIAEENSLGGVQR